jgi:urease accessory protein
MDTATNLLRLLQLASPALPVGAYSYSEGLEALVQSGKITTSESLKHWLIQELRYGAVRIEAAIVVRSHRATLKQDSQGLIFWNQWLNAARETEELRSQSLQMGRSLIRLVKELQVDMTMIPEHCHFAIAFGFVAATWEINEAIATLGYLQSWITNLINAGIKLIPLGQTMGQQLLWDLGIEIESVMPEILNLEDEELASCGWGLSLASMSHETLYSRLFRS